MTAATSASSRLGSPGDLSAPDTMDARLASFRVCLKICGSIMQAPEDVMMSCLDVLAQIEKFDLRRLRRTCGKFGVKFKRKKISAVTEAEALGLTLLKKGYYCILAKIDKEAGEVLLFDPKAGGPRKESIEWLSENTTGELLSIKFSGSNNSLNRFTVKWFVDAFLNYKPLLAEILLSSVFVNLLALMIPLFFQVIIDKVISHQATITLEVLVVVLFVGVALEALITGLRQYFMNHTTTRIDVVLGSKIFDHLIHLPLSYFLARKVGESVARVREIDKIREFLTKASLALTVDLIFMFVFLAVMAVFSVYLTLIVIISIPVYALIAVSLTPVLQRRIEDVFKAGAAKETFLVESISGIETVKATAVEAAAHRSWEMRLSEFVTSNFRAATISAVMGNAFQLVGKLTVAIVLFLGAKLVIAGELTVGQLIAFNMLVGQVNAPLLKIAQLWQDFQRARLSVDRLNDVLQTPTEFSSSSNTQIDGIQGDIRFENVSFAYQPGADPVIKEMNLHISPGQTIGIVGTSGSGKSTLTKLVQRMFSPQQGKVFVDDNDISAIDSLSLRSKIGVVLQENLLFKRTIRENIALADPSASIDKVIKSAKLAGAHEFILSLSEGYDTVIDEMGANLSGGQRQRIAIARALLTDPGILIFDEATSALDYESEEIIQQNMEKICSGRTVLIVAHRLSAVSGADRILALENGVIVEDGSHDELMLRNGRYAHLFAAQSSGQEGKIDA